jgi:serine/threonine protein kinase/Tfp pilus assembly protein PilF
VQALPKSIGPYRPLELLGRGGMGLVYRAEHGETGEHAAVKTLALPSEKGLASLRREIHALACIRHPGIVRIVDEGVEQGLPWYAMELVEGRTLRSWAAPAAAQAPGQSMTEGWWTISLGNPATASVSRLEAPARGKEPSGREPRRIAGGGSSTSGGRVAHRSLGEILTLARRLCAPLSYLHGEGLVHRDLKPENILLQPDGMPVLVDFGLVSRFSGELSREALEGLGSSAAAGTLAYMAPEQLLEVPLDARADLYALGCLLYELLAGRPPFVGKPRELIQQHLQAMPLPPSRLAEERAEGAPLPVPPELDALVLRLLAKQPRDRLGHADSVAAALVRLGAEDGLAAAGLRPKAYLYRPSLAGREDALRQLEEQLARLQSGAGGFVLLGGESGVGKTRLALELARLAERSGIAVLPGECPPPADPQAFREGAGSAPLSALRKPLQSIADRCRSWGKAETERLLGRRAPVLSPYEPTLRGLPGQEHDRELAELPPEAARLRLNSALAETLWALARAQPLLLVLDDLQWADELTLDFLGFLKRVDSSGDPRCGPLLVLGTYRTEELGEALSSLLELGDTRHLRLGRLEEPAVGQMVRDMLALGRSPTLFARYLSRHSEGNPFFVAEYLRTAVEMELLFRDEEGRWQVAESNEAQAEMADYERLALPRTLRELLWKRLQGLPVGGFAVALAAAVLGREVPAALLGPMTGLPEKSLFEAVQELLRQHIFTEPVPGTLRFTHEKLREVAYARLAEPSRRRLHREAAEALEALGPERREEHLAALGHHWEVAAVAGKARECYLAAARKNKDRYAHAEAARLYRAYLGLTEEPTAEGIAARNELGREVLGFQGRLEEASSEHHAALEAARGIGDRRSEVESLRLLGQALRTQGRIEQARELFADALAIVREVRDPRLEGRVLGDLATAYGVQGQIEEARQRYEQALAILSEVGDRRFEGLTLSNLASCYSLQGQIEEARRLYRQALVIHREVGNRQAEGVVLDNLATSYQERGWFEEARELYEQALVIQREAGSRLHEGLVLAHLANSHYDQGRIEAACQLYEQALVICQEAGDRRHEGLVLGNLANARHDQGQIAEANELYERALAIHRAMGNQYYEGSVLCDLANSIRLTTNGLDRAAKLARDGEALLSAVGDRMELGRLLCVRGHIELAGGKSAREVLDRAETLARELHILPGCQLGQKLTSLRRAQQAFDSGRTLFRGELIEDLPEGLRRWLLETGQLDEANG